MVSFKIPTQNNGLKIEIPLQNRIKICYPLVGCMLVKNKKSSRFHFNFYYGGKLTEITFYMC